MLKTQSTSEGVEIGPYSHDNDARKVHPIFNQRGSQERGQKSCIFLCGHGKDALVVGEEFEEFLESVSDSRTMEKHGRRCHVRVGFDHTWCHVRCFESRARTAMDLWTRILELDFAGYF